MPLPHPLPRPLVRPGFTLIEALIVIVMIGIMMAVAVPRMTATRITMALDQATQQLQSDLRRAQSEAIRQNQTIDVTRVNDSTYSIESIGNRFLPSRIKFGNGTATSMQVLSFGPPVGGSKTFIVTLNSRKRTITVNAVGRISASTETAL